MFCFRSQELRSAWVASVQKKHWVLQCLWTKNSWTCQGERLPLPVRFHQNLNWLLVQSFHFNGTGAEKQKKLFWSTWKEPLTLANRSTDLLDFQWTAQSQTMNHSDQKALQVHRTSLGHCQSSFLDLSCRNFLNLSWFGAGDSASVSPCLNFFLLIFSHQDRKRVISFSVLSSNRDNRTSFAQQGTCVSGKDSSHMKRIEPSPKDYTPLLQPEVTDTWARFFWSNLLPEVNILCFSIGIFCFARLESLGFSGYLRENSRT